MQQHVRIGLHRLSREAIEQALTHHAEHSRIGVWSRGAHDSGHTICLIGGRWLETRSLRETALVVLALASAEQGGRPRKLSGMNPAKRRQVTERAMAQVGAELQAAAPQISAIMTGQAVPDYRAQALAAQPLMENLLTRMRNLAGELESRGWQCEVVDGSWVFTLPQEVPGNGPG